MNYSYKSFKMKVVENIFYCIQFALILFVGFLEEVRYKLFGKRIRLLKDEDDINGKVVIITGASRGMGKASALEFASRGAIVILGCVDLKEGNEAAEEIREQTGNTEVEMIPLDLADMSSVEKFSKIVCCKYTKIKILLNNAGLPGPKSSEPVITEDGFNLQMAVNHMGHFLLTNLLLDNLKRGCPSRIVTMSSLLQLSSQLDLSDLMMFKSGFGPNNHLPYSNSKFANALFTKDLGRRLKGTGVTTYAVCPSVVKTGIFDEAPLPAQYFFHLFLLFFGFTPQQAASEFILHCALDKSIETETGQMYRFKKHFTSANKRLKEDLAKSLWEVSAKMLNLDDRIQKFRKNLYDNSTNVQTNNDMTNNFYLRNI